jgi:hypothetical protein
MVAARDEEDDVPQQRREDEQQGEAGVEKIRGPMTTEYRVRMAAPDRLGAAILQVDAPDQAVGFQK